MTFEIIDGMQVAHKISDKNSKDEESKSRYWTEEEHQRFLEAINIYGPKDVKNIAKFVGTRNPTQVRSHAQKYSMKMSRQQKSGTKGGKQAGGHGSSNKEDGGSNGNGSGSGSVNEGDGSETWSDQVMNPASPNPQGWRCCSRSKSQCPPDARV